MDAFSKSRLAGQSPFPAQRGSSARRGPKAKAAELKLHDTAQGAEVLEGVPPPFRTYAEANLSCSCRFRKQMQAATASSGDWLVLAASMAETGHALCMCSILQVDVVAKASGIFPSSVEAWSQPLFPAVDNSVPVQGGNGGGLASGWHWLVRRWGDTPPACQGPSAAPGRDGTSLAIQHFASSQVVECVKEAYAEEPGAKRWAAPAQLSYQDWEPLPACEGQHPGRRRTAGAFSVAVALHTSLGSVPAAPLPAQEDQDSLEEDLFMLPMSVEWVQKLHVRASVHWSAPGRAWSTTQG